jgi:hypothetical protein
MQLTVQIPDGQDAVLLPAGVFQWTEDEFFCFCQANRDLRIERSAKGEIIVMSPAGGYAGYQSGEVFRQLSDWAVKDKTGLAFDSSTGFRLPNGAMRAPPPGLEPSREGAIHSALPRFCDGSGIALGHIIESQGENERVPKLWFAARVADPAGVHSSGNLYFVESGCARLAGNSDGRRHAFGVQAGFDLDLEASILGKGHSAVFGPVGRKQRAAGNWQKWNRL